MTQIICILVKHSLSPKNFVKEMELASHQRSLSHVSSLKFPRQVYGEKFAGVFGASRGD